MPPGRNIGDVLSQTLGTASEGVMPAWKMMLAQQNYVVKQKMEGELDDFNRSIKMKQLENTEVRTAAYQRNVESQITDREKPGSIGEVLAGVLGESIEETGGVSPEAAGIISETSQAQSAGKRVRNMFTAADAQLAVGGDIAKANRPFLADVAKQRTAFQKTLGVSGRRFDRQTGEQIDISDFQYAGPQQPADTSRIVNLRMQQIVDDFGAAGQDPLPELQKYVQGIIDYYGQQYVPGQDAGGPAPVAPGTSEGGRLPGVRKGQFSQPGDVTLNKTDKARGKRFIRNFDKLNLTQQMEALRHLDQQLRKGN